MSPSVESSDQNFLKIGDFNITNSLSEKLLSVTFGCKLKSSNHIDDICKKATRNLITLSRIVPTWIFLEEKCLRMHFLGHSLITVS